MAEEIFQQGDEEESYRFTEKGILLVLNIYEDFKEGATVEELELKYNLDPGEPNTPEHHLEFRILMAMAELSGVIDKYEEYTEMQDRLDKIEDDFLYGEDDENS